jgi:putative DNA primase/helicase
VQPTQRADTDPWTVPQSVRDRFVQDGHRFYFPDGAPAFKDRGRRLTTTSENTQVVHSLIQIAQARGWTEVTVSGTERFRQDAWRQARLAGLGVRGYRPSKEERAQLIRALGRNLVSSPERVDSISADAIPSAAPPRDAPQRAGATNAEPRERIAGRLLDHGRDAYRHNPNEDPSYFVRLQTRDGVREIWGRDIERAVTKSLTQPQIGDEVILQRTGRDAVTVKRQERDPQGQFRSKNVEVFRNRWAIEKQSFFEARAAAAQIVRDEGIAAREAVREHPELAGTYLNLRAAELASRALRDPQDRRRFVSKVRSALADDIEQGEPLQPVRLRERVKEAKAHTPLGRE